MNEQTETRSVDNLELVTDIVTAYLSNNHVNPIEIPALIANVHSALAGLGQPPADEPAAPEKATAAQVRKSITPDAIISFIDGKPYKALKRHLTTYGLDPASYRERYGLPSDYPMTAANYSAARSALAHSIGLGRPRASRPPEAAEATVAAPKGGGRKKVAEQA